MRSDARHSIQFVPANKYFLPSAKPTQPNQHAHFKLNFDFPFQLLHSLHTVMSQELENAFHPPRMAFRVHARKRIVDRRSRIIFFRAISSGCRKNSSPHPEQDPFAAANILGDINFVGESRIPLDTPYYRRARRPPQHQSLLARITGIHRPHRTFLYPLARIPIARPHQAVDDSRRLGRTSIHSRHAGNCSRIETAGHSFDGVLRKFAHGPLRPAQCRRMDWHAHLKIFRSPAPYQPKKVRSRFRL